MIIRPQFSPWPCRRSLGSLRTDTRRMYFAAILMYKIHRSKKPKYLADIYRRYQPRSPVRGERKDWAIPIVCTNTGLSALQIMCAHLWNSHPSPTLRARFIGISLSSTDSLCFVSLDTTKDDLQMNYDACSKKHISFTHWRGKYNKQTFDCDNCDIM